jgi:hypothetical protein
MLIKRDCRLRAVMLKQGGHVGAEFWVKSRHYAAPSSPLVIRSPSVTSFPAPMETGSGKANTQDPDLDSAKPSSTTAPS